MGGDFGRNALRARMWLARHAQYIRRATGFAQSLVGAGKYGTTLGIGLAGLDLLAESIAPDPWSVVRSWPRLADADRLARLLDHALGPAPHSEGVDSGRILTIAGTQCVRTPTELYVDGPLAPVEAEIAAEVWRRVGSCAEVAAHVEGRIDLRPLAPPQRRTAQGGALVARLRPFIERGKGTSALLVGEPGCGKTTAAAEALATLGCGRSLRIPVRELERISESDVRAAVRCLRPEVLVIDDVDQHSDPGGLLALFDEAGEFARLRIATCNFPRKLGSALLRPGRFDLHVRADDPEVVAARLQDAQEALGGVADALPTEVRAEVENWPIAFVVSLAERVRIVGAQGWAREHAELSRRLAEQREMDESEHNAPSKPRPRNTAPVAGRA